MRRLFAFLVAAVFVVVPVLQLRCAISCDTDDADAAEVCHHHDGTTDSAALRPDEACCQAAVAEVTVVTPEHRAVLSAPALAAFETAPASVDRVTSAIFAPFRIVPSGGPPGPPLVPLRI